MMKKTVIGTLFLLSLFCFLTGCGDYVGKEKSHPLFVKAGASRVAGNFKEAAQYFEEFLYICPRSALAHYELASVCCDNLDDPFRAMYHYGKYLELSPDSSDREDVKKFEEACRKRVFEKLSKEYESAEAEKAYNETARLKNVLSKYVEYSSKLKAQNDQMRKIISERKFIREVNVQPLRTGPAASAEQDPFAAGTATVRTASPAASAASPSDQTSAAAAAKPASEGSAAVQPRIHTVKAGDTLSKISKTYYGTSKYYPEILKANRNVVGSNGVLRPGMKLTIPAIEGGQR